MAFPVSPTNGQVTVVNQVSYQYSSATNSWTRILSTANIITANTIAVNGALTVGTTISATGNISVAAGNFFIGNGSQLTGVTASSAGFPISSGNSNIAATANANIFVSVGGTSNVAVFATTGEYITGVLSASGTITGGNLATGGTASATGNITGGNLLTGGLISATSTITSAANITGGNVLTGGLVSATANVTGGNLVTAGNVQTENIVNITGNTSIGMGNGSGIVAIYSAGNATQFLPGGQVTLGGASRIQGGTFTGSYLTLGTSQTDLAQDRGGNVTVQLGTGGTIANTWTFAQSGALLAPGAVSAVGNVTGGNVLTAGLVSATSTITSAANITGGNVLTGGLVSATGNVTGNYILGNGALLTGVITSVANINNGTSNVTVVSSGGNVTVGIGGTSNVAVFATTGEYITGELSANGNITGGNVLTAGLISATSTITSAANITGGNVLTAGLISATSTITSAANVTGGNVLTGGYVSATGNVTGGNVLTAGLISATSTITSAANVTGGNVLTGGLVSATANVTGGNLLTGGVVSATADITGGNILTGGLISATGNITGGNVNTNQIRNVSGNLLVGVTGGNLLLQPSGNVVLSANTWINNLASPFADSDAATKLYVDNLVSTQISYHQSVNVASTTTMATTTGGTITYTQPNGVANGVGALLTTTGSFNLIDSANVQTVGTRILVKNEANAVYNGVYTWANATNIVRSLDADEYGPNSSSQLSLNDYFFVTGGVINEGSAYIVDAPTGTITFGTSNISFAQFSQSQVYEANTAAGLSLVGTTFSAKVDDITTAFDGGGNIIVKASANLTTPNIGAATGTSLSTTGNVTGGNLLTGGLISATSTITSAANITGGNVLTGGLISAAGNITSGSGSFFIGNGSQLTGVTATSAGFPITAGTSNIAGATNGNIGITVAGASNVGLFTISGLLVTGLISANGNVVGGNVLTAGLISATSTITSAANITGGNLLTAGLISATSTITSAANISGGNVLTGGAISATGNATFGNISTSGSGGNISGANVISSTTLSASGNVIGGNVTTGGLISATGNITGGNLISSGSISASGNVNIGSNYFLGNGACLTGVITSVANINNGTSNVTVVSSGGNVTVGINGTSNVAVFATTGEYITGELSANGNVTGGNVLTGGLVSATANVTGGNLLTAGIISATGNIRGGNVAGSGFYYANGVAIINYTASTTPPASPSTGWQWYNTSTDVLYEYITDGTTPYWVDISSPAFAGGVVANVSISGNLLVNANAVYDIGSSSQTFNNVYAQNYYGNGATLTGNITLGNIINANGNAVGNIGSSSNYFNTIFGKATTAQYADLAENYLGDAKYAPGTVLDFDGAQEVTLSTCDSSKRVAGVVSTNPAHLMNSTLDGAHVVAVALAGRVPTQVTGKIAKGDLMVSAGNGRARAEANPSTGTVIGKALENFDGGEGIIEIVISMQ